MNNLLNGSYGGKYTIRSCSNEKSIGLVTFPIGRAGVVPLSNLIRILGGLSCHTVLITGNDAISLFKSNGSLTVYGITHKAGTRLMSRLMNYLLTQIKISLAIYRNSRKTDAWIFFIGGEGLLLPVLTAKICGDQVIISLAGSASDDLKSRRDSLSNHFALLCGINLRLADKITLYSPNLVDKWKLERLSHKISFAHEHLIDFEKFRITVPLADREPVVGFIGRLSKEKGIIEFVQAMPLIAQKRDSAKFLIGGEGAEQEAVIRLVEEYGLSQKVSMPGWIPHDSLPYYLNKLKLLVLPSHTEGLPNIVLEALSCGTPVLASPVGSISGIIREAETGFLLHDRSPSSIAERVATVLDDPNLYDISRRGLNAVKEEFSSDKATNSWMSVID